MRQAYGVKSVEKKWKRKKHTESILKVNDDRFTGHKRKKRVKKSEHPVMGLLMPTRPGFLVISPFNRGQSLIPLRSWR